MNKRNWLIFEDTRQTPEARAAFDRAVAQVNDGTAQVRKLSGESIRGFVVDGQKILGQAVLEYVLEGLSSVAGRIAGRHARPPCGAPAAPFDAESARAFAERMRLLLGWHDIDYLLHRWVDRRLRDPHFVNKGNDWREQWVLKEGADPAVVSDGLFRFACYVAICDLVRPQLRLGQRRAHLQSGDAAGQRPAGAPQARRHGRAARGTGGVSRRGHEREGQ